MSRISIGTVGRNATSMDLDILLRTRMLIQANSGKGKSWLLRRIAEQAFGKVQTIIIDPEGEFATLREKFAYVLVGKGGETAAHPRIAALTAQRLLELRASAVCDLYEMKPSERHAYVRAFLEALIDAPKSLWHPLLLILDEAHVYCPEKGAGESEASDAVIGMATRGRKRGFCLVGATQRVGKLRKDMAAELLNVAIGGTFIDIDRKRAADALGIYGKKDVPVFFNEIRSLERGKFYFLGPAIATERLLVTVGNVQTSHPEAGSAKHAAEPPPAPDKVKAMLPKLADLPKEAEEKARTEAEFKREIRELRSQLSAVSRQQPSVKTSVVPKADPAQGRVIQQLRAALQEAQRVIKKISSFELPSAAIDRQQVEAAVRSAVDRILSLSTQASGTQQKRFEQLRREAKPMLDRLQQILSAENVPVLAVVRADTNPPAGLPNGEARVRSAVTTPGPAVIDGDFKVGVSHRKIVGTLAAYYPESVKRSILALICGRVDGGGFGNNISECRQAGLVEDAEPGFLRATENGAREFAGVFHAPTNTAEMLELWLPKLSAGSAAVLRYLADHPDPIHRSELATAVGRADGGGFGNNLSELRVAGLLVDTQKAHVQANKRALFLDGDAA